MKKTNLIGIILTLLLSISVAAQGAQVSTQIALQSDVRVSFISQDPDPAEPGEYVDVRFKFENLGGDTTEDITVEIMPAYPFSLEPGEDRTKKIGSLQARQKDETGIIVKYRLKIDEDAVEGDNELEIRYKIGNSGWVTPDEFDIQIRTFDAVLDVEKIDIEPDMIKPGGTAKLKLTIRNIADSLLKDINTKLILTSLPIATLESSDVETIKNIEPKEAKTLEFNLIAEPDATSTLYKLPIGIDYSDELGNPYNKSITTALIIGTIPDLSATLETTEIYQSGEKGEVSVRFVNKGLGDIKLLNVILAENPNYEILTPYEVYIGNIDSDDYESADFMLKANDNVGDKLILPLTLNYMDSNNNEYEEKVNIEIKLYGNEQAKNLGLTQGNGSAGLIVVIVIVIVGIGFYIFWKKRKKKK